LLRKRASFKWKKKILAHFFYAVEKWETLMNRDREGERRTERMRKEGIEEIKRKGGRERIESK
jgi:hypothetical protein